MTNIKLEHESDTAQSKNPEEASGTAQLIQRLQAALDTKKRAARDAAAQIAISEASLQELEDAEAAAQDAAIIKDKEEGTTLAAAFPTDRLLRAQKKVNSEISMFESDIDEIRRLDLDLQAMCVTAMRGPTVQADMTTPAFIKNTKEDRAVSNALGAAIGVLADNVKKNPNQGRQRQILMKLN
jgi:hypothetical protein